MFTATKAFISYKNKILIIRESSKYKEGTHNGEFDVVGGRIKTGEKFEDSLLREIKEETGLDVKIGKPFFVNESWPKVNGESWQIIRIFFKCEAENDKINLSKDHDEFLWIEPKDYGKYKIIENLKPAFIAYLD